MSRIGWIIFATWISGAITGSLLTAAFLATH